MIYKESLQRATREEREESLTPAQGAARPSRGPLRSLRREPAKCGTRDRSGMSRVKRRKGKHGKTEKCFSAGSTGTYTLHPLTLRRDLYGRFWKCLPARRDRKIQWVQWLPSNFKFQTRRTVSRRFHILSQINWTKARSKQTKNLNLNSTPSFWRRVCVWFSKILLQRCFDMSAQPHKQEVYQ